MLRRLRERTMWMRRTLLALSMVMGLSIGARAQDDYSHTIFSVGRLDFINRNPNCNPVANAYDPVWLHNKGWTMPRVLWWAGYAGLGDVATRGAMKLGVPRKVAAITIPLALMFGPHIGQAIAGLKHGQRYATNLPDGVFDAWDRSFAMFDILGGSDDRANRLRTWAAGDLLLYCFARP